MALPLPKQNGFLELIKFVEETGGYCCNQPIYKHSVKVSRSVIEMLLAHGLLRECWTTFGEAYLLSAIAEQWYLNGTVTTEVPVGIYRHYKGNLYSVYGRGGRHSETLEPLTDYQCLYGDFSFWKRPTRMFFEMVTVDDKSVPRFERLTESEEQEVRARFAGRMVELRGGEAP